LLKVWRAPEIHPTKTRKDSQDGRSNNAKIVQGGTRSQSGYRKVCWMCRLNNMGTNLLLVSTARGSGISVKSKTKQETFMKMISAGAGLGVGVKDYRVIFVFENDKALSQFLDSGWSGSAQTDAAAKAGDKGGAFSGSVEVAPGVWVYQITKNGLASS
jgi:hypothetical protein